MRAIAAFVLASAVVPAATAHAHDRSVSHLSVQVRGDGATLRLRLRSLDANALAAAGVIGDEALARHLAASVRLEDAGAPCTMEAGSWRALASGPAERLLEWRVGCRSRPVRVHALPVPSRPSHVCFVRVREGGTAHDLALTELAPSAELSRASEGPAFVRFVPVGVAHILGGLDHLVFLAMLLVLAASLRETAALVSGFTLGHSVTLACAALGLVQVDARMVEALIGASIAIVAIENAARLRGGCPRAPAFAAMGALGAAAVALRSLPVAGVALFAGCHLALSARDASRSRGRSAVAALFGLLHGLGFAGAIADSLPRADRTLALLGFNVGVELGQLAVVALAWPLLVWLRRDGGRERLAVELASSAALAAGVFWFVTRAAG